MVKAWFNFVAPNKLVVELKVAVPDAVNEPERVAAPLAVNVVVATLTNCPAPDERIWAKAVPPLGTMIWSNFPVLAEILPVDAWVRSRMPFTESIAKTPTY